jgi:ferredoxin
MPRVVFNDAACEAEIGERLMDVARRNELHSGYLCGGIGVCQTCICQVKEGAEHLSPVNEVEKRFIRKNWLDMSHRMSCQATVRGPGPVAVVSRAEQMRREAMAIFNPQDGTAPLENAQVVINHIGRIFANQLILFPANAVGAVNQIIKNPPSITRIQGVVTDAFRVSRRMVTGTGGEEAQQKQGSQE